MIQYQTKSLDHRPDVFDNLFMHSWTVNRTRHGFTLIEMLVVIAIIAVLAALSFPILSKTQQRGLAVKATSRLQQTFVAFQGYAADNNGNLPAAGGMPDVPGEASGNWVMRIQPYADGRPFSGWKVPGQLAECFVCPVWQQTTTYKNALWNTGFGMNYRLGRPDSPVASTDTATQRKQVSVVKNASRKILVAPSDGWGVQFQVFNKNYKNKGFLGPKRYGNSNPSAAAAQQKGFGIYLFVDGHVQQLTPEELDPFFL